MLDTGAQDKKSENPMAALEAVEAPTGGGGAGGGAGTTFSSAGPLPPVAAMGAPAAGPSASDLAFGDPAAAQGGAAATAPGAAVAAAAAATGAQATGQQQGAAVGAVAAEGGGAQVAQQAAGGATEAAAGAAQMPEEVAAAAGGAQAAAGGAVTKAPPVATEGGQNKEFAEAQAIANQGIAAMSGAPGLVVNAPPAQAPGHAHGGAMAAPSPGSEGGGLAVKPEAGVVGSLQLDYDMCTGRLALIGWVWAGIGAAVQTPLGKQWWGAYTFLEGTICETTLDFMPKLPHGPKPPKKEGEKEEGMHGGWGIAGFPIVLSPGKMGKFKAAGLEIGMLITPDADHNGASVELIALLDVLGYLGPVAAVAKKAVEAANQLTSKVGLSVEMAAGLDASGVVHGWRSPNGLVVDSARVAGGGFIAMGIGLPHSRSALPKGGG